MTHVRQAVIFAGGKGERLRPLTEHTPKPLIRLHGKPFAEYLIELLKSNGIEHIIFLTGYLAEQFPEVLGDGSRWGLRISYSPSSVDEDTGERLRRAHTLLDENFLLLYGDNYWPLNLENLTKFHFQTRLPLTVTVHERHDPRKKNNVLVESGVVKIYDKARSKPGLNGVDIGFFIVEKKKALDLLGGDNMHFESAVMSVLAEQGELSGFLTEQPYWSLTDQSRLPSIARALDPKRKVLFLDRDGTINIKAPQADYIKVPSAFGFLPGAVEALAALSRKGYELYIISNQPGVGRGVMTETDLRDIDEKMVSELAQAQVKLSGIYYCLHDWNDGCGCRKPKAGLLYRAAQEHDIDLTKATFVGDDERDRGAGMSAGVKTLLVPSGQGVAAALPMLLS